MSTKKNLLKSISFVSNFLKPGGAGVDNLKYLYMNYIIVNQDVALRPHDSLISKFHRSRYWCRYCGIKMIFCNTSFGVEGSKNNNKFMGNSLFHNRVLAVSA